MSSKARLSDIRAFEVPARTRDGGTLVAWQGPDVPFAVARVFTVSAPRDALRGDHAHKECAQLLVCMHGRILVTAFDGQHRKEYLLERPNQALLIPPGIFATETYLAGDDILMVLCDRPYDENDYLRGEEKYLAWRLAGNKT